MDTLQTVHDARITPAYAGKRSGISGRSKSLKDHPRVCGEKQCRRSNCYVVLGSPPRMRGKEMGGQ